jgi:hypothetical protein
MIVVFGQLQFIELQNSIFFDDFNQTKTHYCRPGSIPNMMRSFAKVFCFKFKVFFSLLQYDFNSSQN